MVVPTAVAKAVKTTTQALASTAYTDKEMQFYFNLTAYQIKKHRETEELLKILRITSASAGLLGASLDSVGTVSKRDGEPICVCVVWGGGSWGGIARQMRGLKVLALTQRLPGNRNS